MLRGLKLVSNPLKSRLQVWPPDATSECRTITKQQPLEFMHDDERDKAIWIDLGSRFADEIIQ